ncbi:MAG: multiheme c-type cytochrome [Terracidiphilus sp.]
MKAGLWISGLVAMLFLGCPALKAQPPHHSAGAPHAAGQKAATSQVSAQGQACLDCHETTTPAIVRQWKESEHYRHGVDCFSCHKANAGDPAATDHYGQKIAILVTPKYCGNCHARETAEYEHSRHARAAQFIGSLDNVLGEVVEGAPAVQSACSQCHGSTVKYLGNGKFDSTTWPNSGVGRVNPDGSLGSCSACHARHSFSAAQARQPETCGRCHMGPDHPQIEIYNESMHGVLYRANLAQMHLNSKSWIAGEDYSAAPTCVTCHMGGTPEHPESTHDTGTRLSWTLRPAVSIHQQNWQQKRAAMQEVCLNCHASGLVNNFYKQYDATVNLYNTKYGEPAAAIMKKLTETRAITTTPFDAPIKWDYFEMWHHEGRAARMGSAMGGPDFTQWHGFYAVAKDFYTRFLPEAEKLSPGITKNLQQSPDNIWQKGLSREQIQQQIDYYRKRYNQ